jgi:hypothetical protein
MARLPGFSTEPVSEQEARHLLKRGRAGGMSFLLEPGPQHVANAWLYVCRNRSYALDKLANEVRRHIRRAQNALRIQPLEWKTLMENGFAAYSDTRARLGLSDGSLANFRERFDAFSSCPGHYAVGAWQGESLVAFVTLMVVDDWVTLEGSFSVSAALAQRPNNGLAHYVLDHFLVQQGFETVCFGASSIQEGAQHSGLHDYKRKIGFEAKPVHRAFMIHPVLRPFANRVTLRCMKIALRLKPGNRRIAKGIGALNYLLSQKNAAHSPNPRIPNLT